jgi:putative aldouronate transport system substrate-binding protein
LTGLKAKEPRLSAFTGIFQLNFKRGTVFKIRSVLEILTDLYKFFGGSIMKRKTIPLAVCLFVLSLPCLFANGRQAASSSTTPQKITWWCTLSSGIVSDHYSNLGDTPFAKGLMERTGVTIEFLHPPAGGSAEQFNLIIASGDMPDVMESAWLGYPGGAEKAISDGVIVKLNDVFARYSPSITAYLKANPDIDKMIRTDNGSYYQYPMIRDEKNRFSTVTMIRKDWLDELGLSVPETFDEWHTVLTAFKEKKNVVPLSFESGFLLGNEAIFSHGFDVIAGLYVGFDGKIHWGQVEPGFRDYITLMNQWYREGLLDPDFATLNYQVVSTKVSGGSSGASIGWIGSRLGGWTGPGRATNPRFSLVGTPVPVRRKGEKAKFSAISLPYSSGSVGAAITTSCKNVDVAAKVLDWAYSDAGRLYYTFGTEGVSYTMMRGVPTYTDLITKNPNGWTFAQGLGAYTRANYTAPSIPDGRYIEQYYSYDEQKGALGFVLPETSARVVPPITPTPEESREYAAIINDINTYANEMLTKFILGTENLSGWDTYVRTINGMGLARALEIQNKALARYNKR